MELLKLYIYRVAYFFNRRNKSNWSYGRAVDLLAMYLAAFLVLLMLNFLRFSKIFNIQEADKYGGHRIIIIFLSLAFAYAFDIYFRPKLKNFCENFDKTILKKRKKLVVVADVLIIITLPLLFSLIIITSLL